MTSCSISIKVHRFVLDESMRPSFSTTEHRLLKCSLVFQCRMLNTEPGSTMQPQRHHHGSAMTTSPPAKFAVRPANLVADFGGFSTELILENSLMSSLASRAVLLQIAEAPAADPQHHSETNGKFTAFTKSPVADSLTPLSSSFGAGLESPIAAMEKKHSRSSHDSHSSGSQSASTVFASGVIDPLSFLSKPSRDYAIRLEHQFTVVGKLFVTLHVESVASKRLSEKTLLQRSVQIRIDRVLVKAEAPVPRSAATSRRTSVNGGDPLPPPTPTLLPFRLTLGSEYVLKLKLVSCGEPNGGGSSSFSSAATGGNATDPTAQSSRSPMIVCDDNRFLRWGGHVVSIPLPRVAMSEHSEQELKAMLPTMKIRFALYENGKPISSCAVRIDKLIGTTQTVDWKEFEIPSPVVVGGFSKSTLLFDIAAKHVDAVVVHSAVIAPYSNVSMLAAGGAPSGASGKATTTTTESSGGMTTADLTPKANAVHQRHHPSVQPLSLFAGPHPSGQKSTVATSNGSTSPAAAAAAAALSPPASSPLLLLQRGSSNDAQPSKRVTKEEESKNHNHHHHYDDDHSPNNLRRNGNGEGKGLTRGGHHGTPPFASFYNGEDDNDDGQSQTGEGNFDGNRSSSSTKIPRWEARRISLSSETSLAALNTTQHPPLSRSDNHSTGPHSYSSDRRRSSFLLLDGDSAGGSSDTPSRGPANVTTSKETKEGPADAARRAGVSESTGRREAEVPLYRSSTFVGSGRAFDPSQDLYEEVAHGAVQPTLLKNAPPSPQANDSTSTQQQQELIASLERMVRDQAANMQRLTQQLALLQSRQQQEQQQPLSRQAAGHSSSGSHSIPVDGSSTRTVVSATSSTFPSPTPSSSPLPQRPLSLQRSTSPMVHPSPGAAAGLSLREDEDARWRQRSEEVKHGSRPQPQDVAVGATAVMRRASPHRAVTPQRTHSLAQEEKSLCG